MRVSTSGLDRAGAFLSNVLHFFGDFSLLAMSAPFVSARMSKTFAICLLSVKQ